MTPVRRVRSPRSKRAITCRAESAQTKASNAGGRRRAKRPTSPQVLTSHRQRASSRRCRLTSCTSPAVSKSTDQWFAGAQTKRTRSPESTTSHSHRHIEVGREQPLTRPSRGGPCRPRSTPTTATSHASRDCAGATRFDLAPLRRLDGVHPLVALDAPNGGNAVDEESRGNRPEGLPTCPHLGPVCLAAVADPRRAALTGGQFLAQRLDVGDDLGGGLGCGVSGKSH